MSGLKIIANASKEEFYHILTYNDLNEKKHSPIEKE